MSLRVILLKRTALLNKEQYTEDLGLSIPVQGPWVTMGHFDAMYSYLLDTNDCNIFSAIHNNNGFVSGMNNGDSYHHSLYLLTEEDDAAFWAQKAWFMAVTRIHLTSTTVDISNVEVLSGYIQKQCQEAGFFSWIYQTVELSDLILVVKSNRISNLLYTILNLWSHPGIGKLYTYCGIDYAHLQNAKEQPDEDDQIDFLSIRFAIRDSSCADQFFDIIKEQLGADLIYSITGVDDAILNLKSLPIRKLVSFFHLWLVEGLPKNINLPCIFSDITTRLGAQHSPCLPDYPVPDQTDLNPLNQQCLALIELSCRVQRLAKDKPIGSADAYWLRNLSELSFSLLRLSRTAMLDELVYLIFPGVKSFLINLEDIFSDDDLDRIFDLSTESCCEFIDSWSYLMEHVMRMEGQLAHHPEIRPILYDIPLAMLEHTLALLDLCCEVLQAEDSPQKEIHFILAPMLCDRISVEEIFAANDRLPGLLLISIPLHMMYEPREIQIELCHEISHYIGEKLRNRAFRYECYLPAIAALMADLIFETDNDAFIALICKRLDEHIDVHEDATIADYQQSAVEWITNELTGDDAPIKYSNLVRDALRNQNPLSKYDRFYINSKMDDLRFRSNANFKNNLPPFTNLFGEVFADICMMCLLNLDAYNYINVLCPDINGNPDCIEAYSVRIFTTLSAMEMQFPARNRFPKGDDIDEFFKTINRLKNPPRGRFIPQGKYRFPTVCVNKLLKYAKKCANDIKILLTKDDHMRQQALKLSDMYHNVVDTDMDYRKLHEFIISYRKKIITEHSH